MALDPRIAMGAQVVDLSQPSNNILQAVSLKQQRDDQATRRKLEAAQLAEFEKGAKTREAQSFTERELAAAKSLSIAAVRVKPLLDAGDVEGAKAQLMQRKARLDEEGIDSNDTQELLGMLEKDPKVALDTVSKTIEFGTRMGFLNAAPEQFVEVKDDNGKIVAQKSTTTGKVLEDPRSPRGRSDYFTPVPTATGNVVFDNRRGVYIDPATNQVIRNPVIAAQHDPKLQGDITGAKKEAEARVEKQTAFPKARNTLTSLEQQWDLVDDTIARALQQISPFTAGAGAWTKVVPASPAKDLEQSLETIKANVGFDKLQDMRANSPTGGALGQVSDFENKLLQSVKGSMVQNQSPSQLRSNLERVRDDLKRLREEKAKAFGTDFQDQLQQQRRAEFEREAAEFLPQQPAPIAGDEDYEKLPSGTVFVGPDGVTRRKP